METILTLFTHGFYKLNLKIDITSFNFYGGTEGYETNTRKSLNSVSFRLMDDNLEDAIDMIEHIKSLFKLNPDNCDVNDYVLLQTNFKDWEEDLRPMISIKLCGGRKNMINPPSFTFKKSSS